MSESATVVRTVSDRCRSCYNCVSHCPARAIRIVDGRAEVIAERCIACGYCVRVCTQQAKQVQAGASGLKALLTSGRTVWAALDPSFPAAFPELRPGQLATALRRLGFAHVAEVAFGAELVGRRYADLARSASSPPTIASYCPAVIHYVQRYVPSLVSALAPVVSPTVALGRALKQTDPDAAVVLVGPCLAKKAEIQQPEVAGAVDVALTYVELRDLLHTSGVEPAELPDSELDGPPSAAGRVFAVAGGLLRVAGIPSDVLQGDVMVVEGKDDCLATLHELAAGRVHARLVDVRFCRGCVDGPAVSREQSHVVRTELVTSYARSHLAGQRPEEVQAAIDGCAGVDLGRGFEEHAVRLSEPTEDEIAQILRRINRAEESGQLDCGACGYATCREKAIAVYQGLAEPEACVPYLVEQRRESLRHEAEKARFVSAVVHEVRAPLSAIRAQLEALSALGGAAGNRAAIVASAERIDSLLGLINDLLDLSRVEAGELAREVGPVDVGALLHGVACLQGAEALANGIAVEESIPPDLPVVEADKEDMVRLFTNLLSNAVKYNRPGGRVWVRAWAEPDAVRVEVGDTGIGIAAEHLPHLFEEFYRVRDERTRGIVGSGLGLALVRRVADAYRATIDVESQPGRGTTFTTRIPTRYAPPGLETA